MSIKNSFHLYAIITILFWSLGYVLTRLALQYFSAFSLGFLRYFVASCTLVVVVTLTKMKLPKRTDLPWLLLASLALSVYSLLQRKLTKTYTAMQATTYSIFFGTLLLAIFAPTSIGEISQAPAIQFFYVAILGICYALINKRTRLSYCRGSAGPWNAVRRWNYPDRRADFQL